MGWRSAYRAGNQFGGWATNPGDLRRTPGPIFGLLLIVGFVGYLGKEECNCAQVSSDAAQAKPNYALPSGASADSNTQGDLSRAPRRTHCGDPAAQPYGTDPNQWPRFRCRNPRFDAGERCFARTEYSDTRGMGCPRELLCCSP